MADFTDITKVLNLLDEAQENDKYNRDLAKEDHKFVTVEDGQWEDNVASTAKENNKPKYTFDMSSPIVDQISGQIEKADFDIKIKPTGGDATKEKAEFIDGMVRNIETISDAQTIYSQAGRNVVTAGIDGWMVTTRHVDTKSFEQDILIDPIHNFDRRVWFDVGSQRQDRSDSNYGFLLSQIPLDEYKELFPDGSGQSVSNGDTQSTFCNNAETVTIGHLYFRKLEKKTLVQTNRGRVFIRDDDLEKVTDELAEDGETIENTRDILDSVFYMRKFDGQDWLAEEEETVFSTIPLVVAYGNFKVIEGQTQYYGVIRKLKDPQRVLNYSLSREIEEGALAPRAKYFMTTKEVEGYQDTLQTLNTNSDPVQFYNADPETQGRPVQSGGAQINPGLRVISDGMEAIMSGISGIFAAGMGDNPNAQSGLAIGKLQDKGNNISSKFFKALEIPICYTGRLVVDAIPKVYDTKRQVRIMNEDGTFDMQMIMDVVFDEETQEDVTLNDLSTGKYDVTCVAGPSFDSRQSETVAALSEIAGLAPEVMSMGLDVILKNIPTPGTDTIGARARQQLLVNGVIPEDQMTPEELKAAKDAAAQPKEPSADMVFAQAEQLKAEAEGMKVQVMAQRNQVEMAKAQNRLNADIEKLRQSARKLELDGQQQEIDFAEKQAKLGLDADDQEFKQMMEIREHARNMNNDLIENLNTQANTLKTIREGMGVETFTGPGTNVAFINQAREVTEAQAKVK